MMDHDSELNGSKPLVDECIISFNFDGFGVMHVIVGVSSLRAMAHWFERYGQPVASHRLNVEEGDGLRHTHTGRDLELIH